MWDISTKCPLSHQLNNIFTTSENLRSDKILISVFEENVFYDSIGFKNWYSSVSSLANSYNIDMKDMPFNDD